MHSINKKINKNSNASLVTALLCNSFTGNRNWFRLHTRAIRA